MGTILARKRKRGGMAYMAKIILKRDKKVIHRESRTFEAHKRAKEWIRDREAELAKPGEIERISILAPPLADAINRYTAESRRQIGKTKEQVLNSLLDLPIAGMACDQIKSSHLVDLAKHLLDGGRQPSTVGNYMSHLAAVFAIAKPAWQYPLDYEQMKDAQVVAKRLGYISKSRERDRRPTLAELDRIMTHFAERSRRAPQSIPMHYVIAFAIFSTRRQEEITRIVWADLDEASKRIMVRDMKNPGEKIGNDTLCDLPDPCLAIIAAMPRRHAEIFPYSTDAISAGFTRACQFLGIDDLHFHDLRHDGVSRYFELGWNIPHVAAVSGHRSWQSLKRYTHLRQSGDKYADWKWLEVVTQRQQRRMPKLVRGSAST